MEIPFGSDVLKTRTEGTDAYVFDAIRKKYILLTPEEWVRQHLLHFLMHNYGYPRSLISVEKQLMLNTMRRRTDIVLYNRLGKPALIVECKAPSVPLSQATFEQIARYNLTLRVPYLWVSNGRMHFLCRIDHHAGTFLFMEDLPDLENLLG